MKKASVLAQVLDRLRLTRNRHRLAPSATRPMSDRELARAIRELKRTAAAERAMQLRASALAELRQLRRSLDEEDACAAERVHELLGKCIKLLRDPEPGTFLGRKTQPFPNEDKE